MDATSRGARVAIHVLMAALFALATVWALGEARESLADARGAWWVALHALAALGFVSLAAREVRAIAAARRAGAEPPAAPHAD